MGSHADFTCQQLVQLVTDYLEGKLPARDRLRFDTHLAGCPDCDAYLSQMKATVAALGRLTADDMPPVVWDELLEAFRGWRTTPDRT